MDTKQAVRVSETGNSRLRMIISIIPRHYPTVDDDDDDAQRRKTDVISQTYCRLMCRVGNIFLVNIELYYHYCYYYVFVTP